MKKNSFKFLTMAVLCAGALFTACNDDDNKGSGNTLDPNYNADDFFQEQTNSMKQTFQLTTDNYGDTITLKGGTRIVIPVCGFTMNGVAISGKFTLEAYEMQDVSDMILSGTNTNYATQNRYFESDGYVNIDVKKDGVSVDQAMGCDMTVRIPTDKPTYTNTNLWAGNVDANGNFGWQQAADTVALQGVVAEGQGDSIGGGDGKWWPTGSNFTFAFDGNFTFSFQNLGWYNCDVLWGNNSRTTVTVGLTGYVGSLASYMQTAAETYVAFVADTIPVVAQLYTQVNDSTVKSYDNSMPMGMEGTLIAFTVKNGKIGFASKHITITANMKETLDLKEITKQTLLDAIKKLDVKRERK